jgi:hypothetical protein
MVSSASAGSWFLNFSPFIYNPTANLANNSSRLSAQRNWSRRLKRKRWNACALTEFDNAYSTDTTKLEKWQQLCLDCKILEPPGIITQCKKVKNIVHSYHIKRKIVISDPGSLVVEKSWSTSITSLIIAIPPWGLSSSRVTACPVRIGGFSRSIWPRGMGF